MGIPFTAPWGSGTLVGWTPLDTPSLDWITRARFRLWTNASVTTRPAGSISVVCAGLRGSPAPIAERQGSPPWVRQGDGCTRGRETESKAIVAIAVEKNGRGLGRIRLQQIGDVSTDSLLPFVQGAVERGAMVHTD